MKTLLLLVTVIISTNSFAGTTKVFTKTFTGNSEEEVVKHVESKISSIRNGLDLTVKNALRDAGCWPLSSNFIEIKHLEVGKFYRVEDDGSLSPFFQGTLTYGHRNCK